MFDEKELDESIKKLKKLEDEIARIDALYEKTVQMFPPEFLEDDGRRLKRDSRIESLVQQAKKTAAEIACTAADKSDNNEVESSNEGPVLKKSRKDMKA